MKFLSGAALVIAFSALACSQKPQFVEPAGAGGAAGAGGTIGPGAGMAGAAGTGVSSSEHCTNGLDDDADGLPDCTDDDCVAFGCETLPPGWQPVVLSDGGCVAGELLAMLRCGDGCRCTLATGTCALAVEVYSDGACTALTSTISGSDINCDGPNGSGYMIVSATAVGHSCTTMGGTVPVEDRPVCSLEASAGCMPGEVCAPDDEPLCLLGNGVCPEGYARVETLYDDGSVASCSCGCEADASCSDAVVGFENNTVGPGCLVTPNGPEYAQEDGCSGPYDFTGSFVVDPGTATLACLPAPSAAGGKALCCAR